MATSVAIQAHDRGIVIHIICIPPGWRRSDSAPIEEWRAKVNISVCGETVTASTPHADRNLPSYIFRDVSSHCLPVHLVESQQVTLEERILKHVGQSPASFGNWRFDSDRGGQV